MSGALPAAPSGLMGRQLWELLPEVYRRSDNGDLASWLEGMGHLLELFRNTLDQRLADCFPDRPLEGKSCQDWLLPYFAELFDARLVSPDPDGQRAEVAQAISWRKSKGTLAVVEQVAQEVGRLEVEVQEGWRRVATTPRIDLASLAPSSSRGTVAFGRRSRAVRTNASDPAGRATRFGDQLVHWRQGNSEGIPCFPGSYEDVSARTPDLRSPNWRQGHVHPRRLLLFYPPPAGFFAPASPRARWTDLMAALALEPVTELTGGITVTRVPVGGRWFLHTVDPQADAHSFRSEGGEIVLVDERVEIPAGTACELNGLSFTGEVQLVATANRLQDVAARQVTSVHSQVIELECVNCLIETLEALLTEVRLEYTTVLGLVRAVVVRASDTLFLGSFSEDFERSPTCLRFSRVPPGLLRFSQASPFHNTEESPLFVALDFVEDEEPVRRPARFGEPGCGVLHPGAPRSIRFGAEDGGEIGAYHERRYSLAEQAVRQKLTEFLPVGLEAVLIPDSRLLSPPPTLKKAET